MLDGSENSQGFLQMTNKCCVEKSFSTPRTTLRRVTSTPGDDRPTKRGEPEGFAKFSFRKIAWAMKKLWLFRVYRGWHPTQLCGDYFIYHYKDPLLNNQDFTWKVRPGVSFSWFRLRDFLIWSRSFCFRSICTCNDLSLASNVSNLKRIYVDMKHESFLTWVAWYSK